MGKIKFKFHPLFLGLGVLLIYFNLAYIFLCYLVALIFHELAHAIVAKKLGYQLNLISLMPYGAELSGEKTVFSERDEVLIAVAGPLMNIALIIITICSWWLFPITYSFTEAFVIANMASLFFNLLPVFPLDGGRVLLALMSTKIGRTKALKKLKIIGIIVALICFVGFIISLFISINITLGVASFFLMAGALDDGKNIHYNRIITLAKHKNFTKKAFNIKSVALNENATLLTAYKSLDANCFNKIHVLNKNMKTKKILTGEELNNLLMNNSYLKKLKEVI